MAASIAAGRRVVARPARSARKRSSARARCWASSRSTGWRSACTRWNAVGNQVLVAHYDSTAGPGERFNMDNWNGYVAARQRLLALLSQPGAGSPIVLTGDIHSNWVCDLKTDFANPASN